MSPEGWGWKKGDTLLPVKMTQEAAPAEMLNMIFCNCKIGCKKSCSCRKSGLSCSVACAHCQTGNCSNYKKEDDIHSDEEDDENILNSEEMQLNDYIKNVIDNEVDSEISSSDEDEEQHIPDTVMSCDDI